MISNVISGLLAPTTPAITVTGGTLYTSGGYNYRVFTANGNLVVSGGSITADILLIGGGGGGSTQYGGGGGAGGLCQQNSRTITAGTYGVVIGGGGAGVTGTDGYGGVGVNSTFDTVTANGGGRGGYWSASVGRDGGSGGAGGGGSMGSTASTATTGGAATQGTSKSSCLWGIVNNSKFITTRP